MKITLIQVGKTIQPYLQEGINEYTNRLKHYCSFEMITLSAAKSQNSTTVVEQVKKNDSQLILSKIKPTDFVILLDEAGAQYNSLSLAAYINQHQLKSTKNLVFIIGGAFGFSQELYQRSNHKLSLSKLTFSHQMVRLFFVEQLYRAFTIIKGESYHHQ
jgi:23S rRNA (pseudouridine1915-N3)-methyltransferase